MVGAALAALVMHQFLPHDFRISPRWVYPAFLLAFLVVLIVGDPGRIDRQRRWLRVATALMIALITLVNAGAAARLVAEILGKGASESAGQLLGTGAIIWLTNVIAFALWYWDLDGGGSAARLRNGMMHNPAFVFPEMHLPELVPADWSPQFMDYLALSFSTATAFSPTDVSAIKRWAKALFVVQSLISLALATLVVARAVNIL